MARILVVDDDDAILYIVSRVLEGLDMEVVTAGSGQEALALFTERRPDAVLTDVYMPDVDGIELILGIRDVDETVPIVAMSGGGYAPADFVLEDAAQLGADAILNKPFQVEDLVGVIQSVLGGS